MRYLQIRLTSTEVTLHPLVSPLTDPDILSDARMLNWFPSYDPPRVTVLLYLKGDLDRFETVLSGTDLVIDYDVTPVGANRGYLYIFAEPHPLEWELFDIGTSPGLLPIFPIQYHPNGSLTVRILGPAPRLKNAVEAMPTGVETSIEQVGEYDLGRPPIPPSLPPRQQEALEVALELGFYEVPREASRVDVAERLGCAPSTASEHLQKAERRIVRVFLDRQH